MPFMHKWKLLIFKKYIELQKQKPNKNFDIELIIFQAPGLHMTIRLCIKLLQYFLSFSEFIKLLLSNIPGLFRRRYS